MSRNTIQQEIICEIVKNMRTHPSPDEVYKEVHEKHPSISRATVYRVLNKLADKGEVLKINLPGTADRFDFHTDDHLHFYCKKCGRVFDANVGDTNQLLHSINKTIRASDNMNFEGFTIAKVNLSIEGVCPTCKNSHN